VARVFGAHCRELLEVFEADASVAGQMEKGIEQHAAVAGLRARSDHVEPFRVLRLWLRHLVPEGYRPFACGAHGGSLSVAGLALLPVSIAKKADAVDAEQCRCDRVSTGRGRRPWADWQKVGRGSSGERNGGSAIRREGEANIVTAPNPKELESTDIQFESRALLGTDIQIHRPDRVVVIDVVAGTRLCFDRHHGANGFNAAAAASRWPVSSIWWETHWNGFLAVLPEGDLNAEVFVAVVGLRCWLRGIIHVIHLFPFQPGIGPGQPHGFGAADATR